MKEKKLRIRHFFQNNFLYQICILLFFSFSIELCNLVCCLALPCLIKQNSLKDIFMKFFFKLIIFDISKKKWGALITINHKTRAGLKRKQHQIHSNCPLRRKCMLNPPAVLHKPNHFRIKKKTSLITKNLYIFSKNGGFYMTSLEKKTRKRTISIFLYDIHLKKSFFLPGYT